MATTGSGLHESSVGSGDPRPRLSATVGSLVEAGLSVEEALARLSALGYRACQWPGTAPGCRAKDLDRSGRRGVAAALRRRELGLSGIDFWIPAAHFLDATTVDRAVAAVGEAVTLASDLAEPGRPRPTVSVLLPIESDLAKDATLVARLNEVVAELGRLAGREGVAVADHSSDAPARTAAGLAIGLDPVAELAAGRDPALAAIRAGSHLASARLADLSRSGLRMPPLEPREARLDLDAYLAALDAGGYRRELVVDARQWRDAGAGLAATVERCGSRLAPAGGLR
jgi:sugar phosphate isomerase/epimerase